VRPATFRRLLLSVLLGGLILSLAGAQPAGKADKPAEKKAPAQIDLPPGAIIAVYDNFADALKKMPRAIVLSPDKYQEMTDEIARLRKLLDRQRTRTPSKCLLKGRIEGGLAVLQAQFEFVTEKPGEIVRLGCGLAQATGITLDGRTPQLFATLAATRFKATKGRPSDDDEGFTVQVEKPGDHTLTLDLVLALNRPGAQGFKLDLPRAAITRLELTLPGGAGDVRVGGKALSETLLSHKNNQLAGSLGAADLLDLTWKSPQAGAASPILAAEGLIQVRIDKTTVTTEARLTLRVLGGQPGAWNLLVPSRCDVKVLGDDGRTPIAKTEKGPTTRCKITPRDAGGEPMVVVVTHTQPVPQQANARIAIGPFTVLEAVRQSGRVLVSNTVADWRLKFAETSDFLRREAPDAPRQNPSLVAAFRYGPAAGAPATPRTPVSWLDFQVETVRGQIKTQTAHLLRPGRDGGRGAWEVQTTITVTPRWADIDRFQVRMPADCKFIDEGSGPRSGRVRDISYDATTRLVEVKLAPGGVDPTLQPFSVKLEGSYSAELNPGVPGSGEFLLPRTEETSEQEGSVTIQTPANVELLPDPEVGGELELRKQSSHELTWSWLKRGPERIKVGWRPYRPVVQVSSLADITLALREGRVRQELKYHLPDSSPLPATLLLRVPTAATNLRVHSGAEEIRGSAWTPDGFPAARRGAWQTVHVRPTNPRQPEIVLEYDFALPDLPAGPKAANAFPIPLVVPDTESRTEMRVRVWSEPGLPLPSLAAGRDQPAPSEGWSEQNIEEVPGRTRLPALVLRSVHPHRLLQLRCGEGSADFTVLVDRALVRVEIGDGGLQNYRVSYRLSRLAARHLDFELPAPVPTITLVATLDGKRIDPELLAAEQPERKGRLARLRLPPRPGSKPAFLELSYQLAPDRTASTPVSTSLHAPVLLGDPGHVPTRWQIVAPPSWVVISPEAGAGTPRIWARRGWLAAPRVNLVGADLERWLLGGEPAPAVLESSAAVTPTLVLWRDGTPTVQLIHAPQQAWLLACSLVLVLVGLMLSRLPFGLSIAPAEANAPPRTHFWAWLVLAVMVAAVVLGVLLWPNLAGQVAYGCEPGAAVLLLLALVQWVLHERYRRQIFFLPSFSRSPPGKSDSGREAPRPALSPGEPSTVDAPPRSGSSVERL
jgi:hypothetical protein